MAWIWIVDEGMESWYWDRRDGPQEQDLRPIEMQAWNPSRTLPPQLANGVRVANDGVARELVSRPSSNLDDILPVVDRPKRDLIVP